MWQRRRRHSVLDLWVMTVLVAWLFDIALSSMLNHGRYDLGFYAGRAYGLVASGVVLFAMLFENGRLHAQTVRALAGARYQHLLVVQKSAQLNDANERLEQRVAARTAQLSASNRDLRREVEDRVRAERALQASREELREIAAISSTLCSMSSLSARDEASADAVIAGCFEASEKWKICRIQKLTV